jgi:hypothetical protein
VEGARDVTLPRIARVSRESLELRSRANVEEDDGALPEPTRDLVSGQVPTSSRKAETTAANDSGRSSGAR